MIKIPEREKSHKSCKGFSQTEIFCWHHQVSVIWPNKLFEPLRRHHSVAVVAGGQVGGETCKRRWINKSSLVITQLHGSSGRGKTALITLRFQDAFAFVGEPWCLRHLRKRPKGFKSASFCSFRTPLTMADAAVIEGRVLWQPPSPSLLDYQESWCCWRPPQ